MAEEHPTQQRTRHPVLEHVAALAGRRETEATHRLFLGAVVRGRAAIAWLEGGHIWDRHRRASGRDRAAATGAFGR